MLLFSAGFSFDRPVFFKFFRPVNGHGALFNPHIRIQTWLESNSNTSGSTVTHPSPVSVAKPRSFDGDVATFTLADAPIWGFDGSSTQQAEGKSSDCILKPVALFPDCTRKDSFLVMNEVMLPNGEPHPSNTRATIPDDPDAWFGFEQEYFLFKDGAPLGFPPGGFPAPQGPYYTGVGYKNVGCIARKIVEEHIDTCIAAGINIEGINAEVAKGQWEYQIFGKGSKKAADQMWVARYIMARIWRTIRRGCRAALQADPWPLQPAARLERLRYAHQFLDQIPPRGGRPEILREP